MNNPEARQTDHYELLRRVSARLATIPTSSDPLMLLRWRVLSACEHLLGEVGSDLEIATVAALNAFVQHGADAETDRTFAIVSKIVKSRPSLAQTILPTLGRSKQEEVNARLRAYESNGPRAILRAMEIVDSAEKRLVVLARDLRMPGMLHRFRLLGDVLRDESRLQQQRATAAAAVLYVDDIEDVIPDGLGAIGLLDDDYALRFALFEIDGRTNDSHLHWSEKISLLWDDLPFLQNVDLRHGNERASVTWLDRVNSYTAYAHVLGSEKAPLILLQPSTACSPLHPIISLIGLLLLDALTSAQRKAQSLKVGGTYELDDCVVVFDGVDTDRRRDWLRLRLRDCTAYAPPDAVDRLIPVSKRAPTTSKRFLARQRDSGSPLQRFLGWEAGIETSALPARTFLVSSRRNAASLFDGIQSNGIKIADHGLVQFVRADSDVSELQGAVVLVVSSLSEVRQLLGKGVCAQCILVDGYDRLQHGRHDLPFLMNQRDRVPVIVWSPSGYYPVKQPTWLPEHITLEVSPDDLTRLLELDSNPSDPVSASLWEAATRAGPIVFEFSYSANEEAVLTQIDELLILSRQPSSLPDYFTYYLTGAFRTLRILVASTPCEWSVIRGFAEAVISWLSQRFASLQSSTQMLTQSLVEKVSALVGSIGKYDERVNTRALGLESFLASRGAALAPGSWVFPCDNESQLEALESLIRSRKLTGLAPTILREIPLSSRCILTGWINKSFARRLWAHSPRTVTIVIDVRDREKWDRASNQRPSGGSRPLLGQLSGSLISPKPIESESDQEAEAEVEVESTPGGPIPLTSCVLVHLADEPRIKVLEASGRVIVEVADQIRENRASDLRPGDRILLGRGESPWSPAEEFTELIVSSVQRFHPELTQMAQDWRRALVRVRDESHLSLPKLVALLEGVGVVREEKTVEGWLDTQRASPIAPRGAERDLKMLWPLLQAHASYSADEVSEACIRLRNLRSMAGRALLHAWKGQRVDIGMDDAWVSRAVALIRGSVRVFEVMSISAVEAPIETLGWWVDPGFALRLQRQAQSGL